MIINAIMYSHLFEPECPECGRCGGMVVVWAANAPEQIGALVREHFPRANGDSMMNTSTKPWVRHMDRVAILPWPGIEGAYLCLSGRRRHSPSRYGDKWYKQHVEEPSYWDPQQCEPFVTFTYQSGKVIAEWDGGLGPIQIWYECAADFMGDTWDKAQPHWFFEHAHGAGHWSHLAVEEAGLPQMFIRGDFAGIFAVLKEWADAKSGAERA